MPPLVKQPAPELHDTIAWVNAHGEKITPIHLSDFKNKRVVLYCFQSWCPGCHSVGLPTLQQLVESYGERDDIVFLAIQTVFEGFEVNTYEKMIEVQREYNLPIPFGHDRGNVDTQNRSSVMCDYHTGGTPWFIILDTNHQIVFSDFHLTPESVATYIA